MNATGLLNPRHSHDDFSDASLDALLELEAAARVLDLEDWIVERLRHPESEETRALLIRRDNGQAMTVPLLHIQHSTIAGIACGTLTFAPDGFAARLRSEAMHASWQHAVLGLPFGGAATALTCDPRNLSEHELQRIASECANVQHTHRHVTYRGAGMNECIAGWMSGASACFVSGVSESAGGLAQERISALALFEIIRHWCSQRAQKIAGLRVAIQGFEGMGIELSEMLRHSGAQLVAVADKSGGIIDPMGLNSEALQTHVQRGRVLLEYPDTETVSNADVLQTKCDVLVLADGAGQITETNADHLQARLVVEFVPAALTAAADRSLRERDIDVVPSILAASGAPLAAYMEYSQRESIHWSKSRANAFVRRTVRHAIDLVHASSTQWNVSARHAAITLGVQKVAAATRSKGF